MQGAIGPNEWGGMNYSSTITFSKDDTIGDYTLSFYTIGFGDTPLFTLMVALVRLLLLLCGDVELNPGPQNDDKQCKCT